MSDNKKYVLYAKLIIIISIWSVFATFILNPLIVNLILNDANRDNLSTTIIVQLVGYIFPLGFILYKFKDENVLSLNEMYNKRDFKVIDIIFILLISIFLFLTVLTFNFAIESFSIYKKDIIPSYNIDTTFTFKIFIFGVISIALIPAIYEEFVYRGIFYNGPKSLFIKYLISVVPFTLVHYPFVNVLAAFIFANFIFLVRTKKSLIHIQIIHFIYNVLMIIFLNYFFLEFDPVRLASRLVEANEFLKYGFLSLSFFCIFGLLTYLTISLWKSGNKEKNIRIHKNITLSMVMITIVIFVIFFAINFTS